MHIGRSHHRRFEIAVSIVGGFAASFLTFTVTTYGTYFRSIRGQLLAGDPTQNREYASTLNAMRMSMAGENPMVNALISYGWWMMVTVGSIVAALIIFKMMRRYV